MSQYAILTDLNRCVGCLGCSVACKVANGVDIGSYWLKVLRIGPFGEDGETWPNVYTYFLPVQCQHCEHPQCVEVCPTEASHKLEDGTVQIDKEKCIGCQFCVMACPYGVRYLNAEERVVEKCTLCEQKIAQGELPQCVAQCGGRARWFGKVEDGLDNFQGPGRVSITEDDPSYDTIYHKFARYGDVAEPYTDEDVHQLPNVGNNPSFFYILRGHEWRGGDV